jgi:hypothetical protein
VPNEIALAGLARIKVALTPPTPRAANMDEPLRVHALSVIERSLRTESAAHFGHAMTVLSRLEAVCSSLDITTARREYIAAFDAVVAHTASRRRRAALTVAVAATCGLVAAALAIDAAVGPE